MLTTDNGQRRRLRLSTDNGQRTTDNGGERICLEYSERIEGREVN